MKLTKKQQYELKTLGWFLVGDESSDQDIKDYFALNDKGIKKPLSTIAPYNGYDRLVFAKRDRDLQIASYREDWGDTLNAWSFLDEPQDYVEWVADKLDRPAIICEWHKDKIRWWKLWLNRPHKKAVAEYEAEMEGRINKPMGHRRS